MATLPYFVFSPNSIISLIGLLRGPDPTVPTPAEDWRDATVDVVIPALNEESTIAACLASVGRQTLKPRQILLVDDGSKDRTLEIAEATAAELHLPLNVIRRKSAIGKTPTIKRQAWELDGDVEFILDGDTLLDSENYIARAVEELYKAVGIASACGTILPLRTRDRARWDAKPELRALNELIPSARLRQDKPFIRRIANGITNMYREVLYLFLQRFVYRGQMTAFGTITNPVGCAVAYRRRYVGKLFDKYFPQFGDDLTNSEDIFIGFALLNEGYRNIQLTDVYARTVEPEVQRLPRQLYLWSSSFLQCCYYFDDLLRSAPRGVRAWIGRRRKAKRPAPSPVTVAATPAFAGAGAGVALATGPGAAIPSTLPSWSPDPVELRGAVASLEGPRVQPAASGIERRRIAEPYRQPFGAEYTKRHGRPIGWVLLTSAIEKIAFPASLIIMLVLRAWEPLVVTIVAETIIALGALVIVSRGQRFEYLLKGILISPLRYALIFWDAITISRFASDLWVTRNRKWRK
jgi:glycosyltransferase involved in cell wall biosynthesis